MTINIAGHPIGAEHQPFLIAETGLSHNGSLNRAIEMIRVAKSAGVTAVKFQTFRAQDVCDEEQAYSYQQINRSRHANIPLLETVVEKRINIFRRCEFADDIWPILKAECDSVGVVFMSTPETPSDLDILLRVGIPAIKIGSDNLTNLPMLRYCARDDVGLPILLSCGMSNGQEILDALKITGIDNTVLLCCTSEYPCAPESANLDRIRTMQIVYGTPIGFSDHTQGFQAATVASGRGACVFECHFTLDHNLAGPDHHWSKTPDELADWVSAIKTAHVMLGDGVVRPSAKELEAKDKFQRRVA